jgi:hypothetical protein
MDEWLEFPDALNVDFKDFSSLYTNFYFWGTEVQVNADIINYIGNLLGVSWQLMTVTHRAETIVAFYLARQHERINSISSQEGMSPSYTTITYDEGSIEVSDNVIGKVRARFGLSWTTMSDNEKAKEIINHVKTLWFEDGSGLNIRQLSPFPPELQPNEAMDGQQCFGKSTFSTSKQNTFNLTLDIMDDAISIESYDGSVNLLDNTHVLNEDNVFHIIWLLKRAKKEREKKDSFKEQFLSLHALKRFTTQPQKLKSKNKLKVKSTLRECASKRLLKMKKFLHSVSSFRLITED